jgi:hypothetical protein
MKTTTKKPKRTDDTGVPRQYIEPAPNPMFTEEQRLSILFVRYKESVPCAHTGRMSKTLWTCRVRFKSARPEPGQFALAFSKWRKAGTPVLRDCVLQADMEEFARLIRRARREAKKRPRHEDQTLHQPAH